MSVTLSRSETIFNSFVKKLTQVNKRELTFTLLRNLLYSLLVFVPLGFILVVAEAIYGFGSTVRTIFYYGFLLSFFTTIAFFILNFILNINGLLRPLNPVDYSLKIGKVMPDIKDTISNSLSVFRSSRNSKTFSDELIDANMELVNEKFGSRDLGSFINYTTLKKPAIILFVVIAFIVTSFVLFPTQLTGAVNRYVNHNLEFIAGNLGLQFNITPGNTEVPKGEDLDVAITITSNDPNFEADNINLFVFDLTRDGVEMLREKMELEPEQMNYFSSKIKNITGELIYYADYKGIRSDKYRVTVSENPIVKKFILSVYPPNFTGLPSRTLPENTGDVTIPEASNIYFEIESNKKLSEAGINLNGEIVNFTVNGTGASGSVSVSENSSYTFYLKDEDGRQNKDPKEFKITVIEDKDPTATIIEPAETYFILTTQQEILLRTRITDDYGFSKLTLNYRKINPNFAASEKFTQASIPIQNLNATVVEVPFIWNIQNIKPGKNEQIEYFVEVTDNTGRTGISQTKYLQYKTLAELLKQTEFATRELTADLSTIERDMNNLRDLLRESRNLNRSNEELGLNDPQTRKNLQENIENIQNTLSSTQQKIDNTLKQLDERSMLNQQTLEEYMKMQELFNKINTPELQEMLEKLREALKKNNPDEARDLMKQFNFDEEQFKKNLEQIMNIMEKIENLQKFGELTQKLDDLTKMQEELLEQTKMTDESDTQKQSDLSETQKDLKDNFSNFKDELSELIDKMKNMKDPMDASDLQELLKKLQQKQTEQKMQQSGDQLQKGSKGDSEQTQEDILNDLNEMNSDMQNALENALQLQDMNSKMMQKLQQIKKNLENLSKEQQGLKDKTERTNPSDKGEMDNQRQEQKGLQQDLSKNIDDLMGSMGQMVSPELGKELGNAYNQMDNAGENLERGNKGEASESQGDAKQSLDNAAEMLGDMIGSMQQQGQQGQDGQQGKGGKMGQLMQQLAEIIAQQQGLAGKMGQMGRDGQQGNEGQTGDQGQLTQEQMQAMDRLKLDQQRLSDQLGDLNKEFEDERKLTGERLLGDLNEIQKQMQEVVKDLDDYSITKETLERQSRIISRMLDAQLSQREKDFEQRRESNPGKNFVRISPPEIVIQGPNSINAFKEDYLKIRKEGYNSDYEELIARYLMELRKQGYVSE